MLVEYDQDEVQKRELAYIEASRKYSRCLHESEIAEALILIHNVRGHSSEAITLQRAIGKFY